MKTAGFHLSATVEDQVTAEPLLVRLLLLPVAWLREPNVCNPKVTCGEAAPLQQAAKPDR